MKLLRYLEAKKLTQCVEYFEIDPSAALNVKYLAQRTKSTFPLLFPLRLAGPETSGLGEKCGLSVGTRRGMPLPFITQIGLYHDEIQL